jgi:type I restriction enzyme M protein
MVSFEEIAKNDFNLNIPRYIDSQEPEDAQDIAGHLQGGIPAADIGALGRYWEVCPTLRKTLFKERRPGYLDLTVDKNSIKSAIYNHPEFSAFVSDMNEHFADWAERRARMLKALDKGCHPKEVIAKLGESLLSHYEEKPLVNAYDAYQHLMDYWVATMQDDLYLIAADGWKAETYRIIETDKKGKQRDKGWACDLIPKPLMVRRYFWKEQRTIETLASELETVSGRLSELEEEHSGEDGALSSLDKINKAAVNERLREIRNEKEAADETAVLRQWLDLADKEADLKKQIRLAELELDAKAYDQYPKLSQADVKALVVADKWLAALEAAIHGEMDRLSQQLTTRVKELAERYETPLPATNEKVAELEKKVDRHLETMGFVCK